MTGSISHLGAVRRHARLRPRRDALRQRDERGDPRRGRRAVSSTARTAGCRRRRSRSTASSRPRSPACCSPSSLALPLWVGARRLHRPDRPRDHAADLGGTAAARSARPCPIADAPDIEAGTPIARAGRRRRSPRSKVLGTRSDRLPVARTATCARWCSSPRSSARPSRSRRRAIDPVLPRRAGRRAGGDRLRDGGHRRRRADRLARRARDSSRGSDADAVMLGGELRRGARHAADGPGARGLSPRSPPTASCAFADLDLERAVGRAASADRAAAPVRPRARHHPDADVGTVPDRDAARRLGRALSTCGCRC